MNNTTPALQRGIEILNYIASNGSISYTELEASLGIPKASLSRLLSCLESNHYLWQSPHDKRFQIGNALVFRASQAYENDPIVITSRPVVNRLAEKWDLTFVVYEYRHPSQLLWRVKHESSNGIKTQPEGFATNKLNINAQGQLFLARMPENELSECLNETLQRSTQHTLTSRDNILKRIEEIRKQGYAYQERESSLSFKQLAVDFAIPGTTARLALGCFIPMEFSNVDAVCDDMLLERDKLTECV